MQHATSPKTHLPRRYVATISLKATEAQLQPLREGVTLDDGPARPASAKLRAPGVVELTLTEGRNHQAKRMLAKVGLPVLKLHREAVGELQLDVEEGAMRELGAGERQRAKQHHGGQRAHVRRAGVAEQVLRDMGMIDVTPPLPQAPGPHVPDETLQSNVGMRHGSVNGVGRHTVRCDGGVTLVLTAEQLVKRLGARIVPEDLHLTKLHGVFAPAAAARSSIAPTSSTPSSSPTPKHSSRRSARASIGPP